MNLQAKGSSLKGLWTRRVSIYKNITIAQANPVGSKLMIYAVLNDSDLHSISLSYSSG